METNPSKMNIETADSSPTEWHEEFIIFAKEELELSKKSSYDRVIISIANDDNEDNYQDFENDNDSNYYDDDDDNYINNDDNYTNDDGDDDNNYIQDDDDNYIHNDDDNYIHDDDDNYIHDDDDNYIHDDDENSTKLKALQYNLRMTRMAPLFASQPRLEKICKDWENGFLRSCFKTYYFIINQNDSTNELHEKANDLEYLINLCGSTLTHLDVQGYPTSQIMPIINANCPNLEELVLAFKEVTSQDFENVFSNMPHLRELKIEWQCENSTLPMTLAKSLEQIGGTLKCLKLSYSIFAQNDMFLSDSFVLVFPRLIALNRLTIRTFGISQLLLQSIGEMKNLTDLGLYSCRPKKHPMFDPRINMYPIGNLKNLEKLDILCCCGNRDEFLINLCNNAKKLRNLHITGTNITDIGMSAIDNLQELEVFDLGLHDRDPRSQKNEFITDESIQCLFNQKLYSLNISNCIKITDKAVIKLVENLPNLNRLHIENTKVTLRTIQKVKKLTKHREKPLCVIENIHNVD